MDTGIGVVSESGHPNHDPLLLARLEEIAPGLTQGEENRPPGRGIGLGIEPVDHVTGPDDGAEHVHKVRAGEGVGLMPEHGQGRPVSPQRDEGGGRIRPGPRRLVGFG